MIKPPKIFKGNIKKNTIINNVNTIKEEKFNLENYVVENISIINDLQNLEFINKKINKIYVINLNTNNTRKIYIEIIMKKMNINFNLIRVNKLTDNPFKTMSNSEYGCYLSHLWCLNDAFNNHFQDIIIFEDDIVFHKNFKQIFYDLFSCNTFDFLLLGAYDKFLSTINYKNIKDNLYFPTCNYVLGAHAIYYSQEAIEYTLFHKKQNPTYYDKNLIEIFNHFKKTSAICYPNLLVVELSTTDLNHNYNFLNIQKERKYYNISQINFNFNDYHFIYLTFFSDDNKEQFGYIKTLEDYIDLILSHYYKDDLIRKNEIKNRIDYTFFTSEDFKKLII